MDTVAARFQRKAGAPTGCRSKRGKAMTVFAKKTVNMTQLIKVQDRIGALQLSMWAPHDLMMFKADIDSSMLPDIYIGLPDASLLAVSRLCSGRSNILARLSLYADSAGRWI
jgi:hypothetical protein